MAGGFTLVSMCVHLSTLLHIVNVCVHLSTLLHIVNVCPSVHPTAHVRNHGIAKVTNKDGDVYMCICINFVPSYMYLGLG